MCYVDDIQHYRITYSTQLVDSMGSTAVVKHGHETVNTYRNKTWAKVPISVKDGQEQHVCMCEECMGNPPTISLKKKILFLVLFMALTILSFIILVQGMILHNTNMITLAIVSIAITYLGISICSVMLLRVTKYYMLSVILLIFGFGYVDMIIVLAVQQLIKTIKNEMLYREHINNKLSKLSKREN